MSVETQQQQPPDLLLYIEEGHGRTIDVEDLKKQRTNHHEIITLPVHIGTDGLISCVGVYIPLTPTHCFFAHIFPNTVRDGWTVPGTAAAFVPEDDEEGKALKALVLTRLKDNVRRATESGLAWQPDDEIRQNAVVVCPNPWIRDAQGRPTGAKMVGYYVADAVRELLGFEERPFFDTKLHCDATGLVVNLKSKGIHYLRDTEKCEQWADRNNCKPLTDRPVIRETWTVRLQANGYWKFDE